MHIDRLSLSSAMLLSPLCSASVANDLHRLRNAFCDDVFTFIINGTRIQSDLIEALLLSPAFHEELIADRSSREFFICNDHINASTFSILQELYHFEEMSIRQAVV
jgi:hypothetical protein